jgi:transcriptional regulator of acetoin/glycerol metabolism
VELARRRYFDEGLSPCGVVSDAVFQSWARCRRLRQEPGDEVVFQPVTESRTHTALQKNRHLHQAWLEELPQLQVLLAKTSCAAMLTDATGVLIGATCVGRAHERLMPVATRLGVDLSEEAVGTTAPGVVARTGQAVCVLGGEHFFEGVKEMHCAASPIRDTRGRLVGVLDISSEALAFSFDAASVIDLFAGAIGNRLLVSESAEHLVIRLHAAESMLDTPMVGLLGIDSAGRIAWYNAAAERLLGLPAQLGQTVPRRAEDVFGLTVARLASLPRARAAMIALPNGLTLWSRSELRAPDGRRGFTHVARPVPFGESVVGASPAVLRVNPPPPDAMGGHVYNADDRPIGCVPPSRDGRASISVATLRDADRTLVEQTLRDCAGNVSETARRLGVSRGLIYRRVRPAAPYAPRDETSGRGAVQRPRSSPTR